MDNEGENSRRELVFGTTPKTSYNFSLPKSCIFIAGVLIGNAMVEAAVVASVMPYLTVVTNIDQLFAAKIVLTMEGTSDLMSIFGTFMKEFSGCYHMVLLSSLFYIMGTVTLAAGSIAGVSMLTIGKIIAKSSCAEEFLEDQLKAESNDEDEKKENIRKTIFVAIFQAVGVFFAFLVSIPAQKWILHFTISACIQLIASILFLGGTTLYFMGRFQLLVHMVCRHFSSLFDKGAINQDSPPSPSYSVRRLWRGRIYTYLGDYLTFLIKTPICCTFLVCGIVDSLGSTYFLQQAITMMEKSSFMTATLMILQITMWESRFVSNYLADLIISRRLRCRNRLTVIRIGLGLLLAVVLCSIAHVVEATRLSGVKKSLHRYGAEDAEIPMNVYYLVPQFILLGIMKGLAVDGIEDFFQNELPNPMKSYALASAGALVGVGKLLTLALPIIMNKLSELGGGSAGWLSEDLNSSRLDHVYMILALFIVLDLILFAIFATCYIRNRSSTGNMHNRRHVVRNPRTDEFFGILNTIV